MKLTKTESGYKVSLSAADWKAIGTNSGWLKESQILGGQDSEAVNLEDSGKSIAIEQIKQMMKQHGVTVDDLAPHFDDMGSESDMPAELPPSGPSDGVYASANRKRKYDLGA